MSAYRVSDNCDVKMHHLVKLEKHQRLYYRAKCVDANWVAMTVDCEWAIAMGFLRGRTFSYINTCYCRKPVWPRLR